LGVRTPDSCGTAPGAAVSPKQKNGRSGSLAAIRVFAGV
jgi:hypothetical protein